jgi:hypothetical protein
VTNTRGPVQPWPPRCRRPIPCQVGGEVGSRPLEDCLRRPLTRFVSSMISRHSAVLWRLLGCIGHEPLLPLCGRGGLLWSPRSPVTMQRLERWTAASRGRDPSFSFYRPGGQHSSHLSRRPRCVEPSAMPDPRRPWHTCRPERRVW